MAVLQFNYQLSNLKSIAAGGEGTIYELSKDTVLKYYHSSRKLDFIPHLESLATLPDCFLKPIDIYSNGSKVLGFTMKYVDFKHYFIFSSFFNKNFCDSNGITEDFKISILNKIKKELVDLHAKGIVIGDLNQYNIFFSLKGEVIFVDVDSYQTPTCNHSNVLLDDIKDFLNPVSDRADMWSFNILAFWATSYAHPFKWVKKGDTSKLEERIRTFRSYLTEQGIIIPKLYREPTVKIKEQFSDIFTKSRRYFVDYSGHTIAANIQISTPMVSMKLAARLVDHDVFDIYGNTELVVFKKNVFKVVQTNSKGTIGVLGEYKLTSYPGKSYVMYYDENLVTGSKTSTSVFVDEYLSYFYDKGVVIVSKQDTLHSFDIDTQLSTVYSNSTPAFSKSFILRDSLIQNFGSKKFLVLPRGVNVNLVEIPLSTKNAYCNSGFACIEYLENNSTKFKMLNLETKTSFDVDSYSYFTANKTTVFIPCDGHIKVYNEGIISTELDISVCTKDSKLLFTTSGILLLEDKSVYLLNTK
jgi:serine/threonine protein kinase